MAKTQEQKGILVDPLEWASKNFDKLKTIKLGNTKVTPQMMVRDKKTDVIEMIREDETKSLFMHLSYKEYVLFHRLCYKHGLSPTEFIQKLVSKFEVEDDITVEWLRSIKNTDNCSELDTMPLTQDELYDMLEARGRGKNGKTG